MQTTQVIKLTEEYTIHFPVNVHTLYFYKVTLVKVSFEFYSY